MWSPCHHDLRLLHLLVFFYSDKVGECLERVPCGCFHTEYRLAGMLDELIDYHFVVVIFLAFELCKSADSDHVAV